MTEDTATELLIIDVQYAIDAPVRVCRGLIADEDGAMRKP